MISEAQLKERVVQTVSRLKSQRAAARLYGVSDTSITEILAGKKRPGVKGILSYYGLEKKIVFEKKHIGARVEDRKCEH